MIQYTLEILIDLPRDKVCELFVDPNNLYFWQPGLLSIEPLDGGTNQPGEKTRLRYLHGKREVEMIETLKVFSPPKEFTATFEAKGMWMEVENHFEETGPNQTKWISNNKAQTSGFMMKLIGLLMPGCFKKQSFLYMKYFKAFAEDRADVREK